MLHVPLILLGPGLPRGLRIATPVSLVDLAPTLLALFEAPAPPTLAGRDLAPLWRTRDASWPGRICSPRPIAPSSAATPSEP
jgi:arylsulfatase A-like enzyme